MQKSNTLFLVTLLTGLMLSAHSLWGQQEYVRVEYIKLPTNDWSGYYQQMQQVWKPVYQQMVNEGQLKDWKLFWRRFPAGQSVDYDAVSVTFHNEAADLGNSHILKFYQNQDQTETPLGDALVALNNIANIKVELYKVVAGIEADYELDSAAQANQNWQIDFMSVHPGNQARYEEMEKAFFMPMHQATMDARKMKSWKLCQRTSNSSNQPLVNYLIFNQWSSLANVQSGGNLQDWSNANPAWDLDSVNVIFNEIVATRMMGNQELWGLWDEL